MPLRLQNGLYMQRHAYMLRVAVPYGLLYAQQMRMFAQIARKYDRGYGHFTTRQNIQFNWIDAGGNPGHPGRAGLGRDARDPDLGQLHPQHHHRRILPASPPTRLVDPRPYAEIMRQWSTFHPEFAYLPRKFKIAINGAGGRPRRHRGA